jgi:SAM-dependent methyltransferase
MDSLEKRYDHDRGIWEQCATTYERQIVRGHPDVTGYENFEHSVIDRLAIHLTRDSGLDLYCYDFGCGSGRIHTLLAPMCFSGTGHPDNDEKNAIRGRIAYIGGIDFSQQMIKLAHDNCTEAGLGKLIPEFISFDIGSAFDVPAYKGKHTPFAVSVCNSIGVMQGEEGARKLFAAMSNYVSDRRGIAMISCYCREAVKDFALGNYESTMDVSGQPCWLTPTTWSSEEYMLVPQYYKRAYDTDPTIVVDVFDTQKLPVEKDVILKRDRDAVQKVIDTGAVDTCTGYHSRWYGTDQVKAWMKEFWSGGTLWHIEGKKIDQLRGAPAQLAIVDYNGGFEPLARSWGLQPLE